MTKTNIMHTEVQSNPSRSTITLTGTKLDQLINKYVNFQVSRYGRKSLPSAEKLIILAIEEHELPPVYDRYLKAILTLHKKNPKIEKSQAYIAKMCRVSKRTISTVEKECVRLGLIRSQKNGWLEPNTKTLLVSEHLNCNPDANFAHLCIINNNNTTCTYKDTDSEGESPSKTHPTAGIDVKLAPPLKKQKEKGRWMGDYPPGHVHTDRLMSEDDLMVQTEIRRATTAAGLNEEQAFYCFKTMKLEKGIRNPGGYLRAMINGLKQNVWTEKAIKMSSQPYQVEKETPKPPIRIEQAPTLKEIQDNRDEVNKYDSLDKQQVIENLEKRGIFNPKREDFPEDLMGWIIADKAYKGEKEAEKEKLKSKD